MMTIFAARGLRMKVVIDGNFIAKNNENLKKMSKIDIMYLKRKLRSCRIQIQVEIVRFFGKETKSFIFFNFFPKGGPFGVKTVKIFFSIFQDFIIFFSKIALLGPNRY